MSKASSSLAFPFLFIHITKFQQTANGAAINSFCICKQRKNLLDEDETLVAHLASDSYL